MLGFHDFDCSGLFQVYFMFFSGFEFRFFSGFFQVFGNIFIFSVVMA